MIRMRPSIRLILLFVSVFSVLSAAEPRLAITYGASRKDDGLRRFVCPGDKRWARSHHQVTSLKAFALAGEQLPKS